jgi:hypothetical protein
MSSTEMSRATHERLSEGQVSTLCAPPCSECSGKENKHGECSLPSRLRRALVESLNRNPRLQRLLWECCSFRHRIYIALRGVASSSDIYQAPMGFLYLEGSDGHPYLNTRSLARIEHIRKIASILPWATPIDWKTHADSWDQGVEWAVCNLGSCSPLPDEHKVLLSSELTYQGPQAS